MFINYLNIGLPSLILLMTKVWAAFSGLIVSYLVINNLTPEIQGYFYTFNSLLLMQVFVELGLGGVIVYFLSHEVAKAKDGSQTCGNFISERNQKIASLIKYIVKWYRNAGIIFFFLIAISGFYLFEKNDLPFSGVNSEWVYPWMSLVLLSSINIMILPLWPIIEGVGKVKLSYLGRMIISILSSIGVLCALYLGMGLWALPIGVFINVVIGLIFLFFLYKNDFFSFAQLDKDKNTLYDWRSELFPMQWRVAVSWISGYLTFSSFVPILFYFKGAEVAGRVGLSIALVSGLLGLCSSVSSPHSSKLSEFIALKKYKELNDLFKKIMVQTFIIATGMFGSLYASAYIGNEINSKYVMRIISLDAFMWLVIAGACNAFVAPIGVYLRAYKQEPLMLLSLLSGFLVILLIAFSAKFDSVENLMKHYAILIIFLNLLVFYIYKTFIKKHR